MFVLFFYLLELYPSLSTYEAAVECNEICSMKKNKTRKKSRVPIGFFCQLVCPTEIPLYSPLTLYIQEFVAVDNTALGHGQTKANFLAVLKIGKCGCSSECVS